MAIQPYVPEGYTPYEPRHHDPGTDPKLARLIRDTVKAQEEVSELMDEMAPVGSPPQ
jgi:hypothetical protein